MASSLRVLAFNHSLTQMLSILTWITKWKQSLDYRFETFYNPLVQQKSRLNQLIKFGPFLFTVQWLSSRISFYSDLFAWNRKTVCIFKRIGAKLAISCYVYRSSLIVKWKEMAGEITKAINESKRRMWIPWMWFVVLSTKPPTTRAYAGHSTGLKLQLLVTK